MVNKGETIELRIESAAYEGVGVSRVDEFVVFVRGGVPGDRVLARIVKRKRRYAEAVVEQVVDRSAERVDPVCQHFGVCGGCTWQNASYALQLEFKRGQVRELLERLAGVNDLEVKPTLASPNVYHYRNKMEFTFGGSRWLSREEVSCAENVSRDFALGLHIPRRFDKILDIEACFLQTPIVSDILAAVRRLSLDRQWSPYDSRAHEGYLRNLVIRSSESTGELMVNLVTSQKSPERMNLVAELLKARFPQVTTFVNSVNSTRSPVAAGEEEVYFGPGTITERIGQLSFLIGPLTFFQPNTLQAERLYQTVSDFARLTGSEVLLDLYCGVGGISLFLAGRARQVTGVENQEKSVVSARENADRNGIANCTFLAQDAVDFLRQFEAAEKPDVVTIDPPRAGLHPDVCRYLLHLAPARVVYVSCNPATQARDLQVLLEKYQIEQAQPVDMFPQTYHIENVVALALR